MKIYNNIPPTQSADSADRTKNTLNNFYGLDLPIDAVTYDAVKGFFTANGFSTISSETIAYTIFYQAYIDGYNPMQVLENIQGLSGVELNALVTEILNFNRFKTSFLGIGASVKTISSVSREILS